MVDITFMKSRHVEDNRWQAVERVASYDDDVFVQGRTFNSEYPHTDINDIIVDLTCRTCGHSVDWGETCSREDCGEPEEDEMEDEVTDEPSIQSPTRPRFFGVFK